MPVFRTRALALSFLVLALPGLALSQALDRDLEKALGSIRPMDAYEYTKTLASPQFAGRLTGHEGYTAAARWAAAKFRSWGLRSIASQEPFLQPYPSPYTIIDRAEMILLLPDGKEMKLAPERDFLPLLFADGGDRTAEAVFAGWGISAPEIGYDDYAGIDIKGKFVFCFRGTPDGDRKYQHHDEHRTRMRTALEKGALGIIYIYTDIASNPNGDWLEGFTPAMISDKVMDAVLEEKRSTAAELRRSLTTFKRPLSFPLQTRVKLTVASRHFPQAVGYNIVGFVEGSDPKLRQECLVVGGHFDHCGTHMGLLFPGANDNASGSAAVMEVAQAFAGLARKPKRSVAFALFGGEELGLQGSTFFVDNVPAPVGQIDAMINYDMVGAGDGLRGGVSAEPAAFKETIERADKHVGILRGLSIIRNVGVRGSDFAPFFAKGIPSASMGSSGPHLFYHQTGDTIFRINPDMMAEAAKLAFLAAYFWADR
ncbi:MAG: M28 family peptidase [Candidatus Aminicenantes bacterium]